MVSLNANLAKPNLPSYVAKVSPHQALKKIAVAAGYGGKLPEGVPELNLFLDAKAKWHLAYVVEDVRSRKKGKPSARKKEIPLVFDYVIDALNGAVVAELPRTPTMTGNSDSAPDELGHIKTFSIEIVGRKRAMRDARLNIETYDFAYRDPIGGDLPGQLVAAPWSPAAVSAHTNAAHVATFLREVLKRNNIDNKGGRVVSTVNCVVKQFERPPGSRIWLNAFWDGTQMLYGQAQFDGKLRSLASSLAVVAHELFHGVTGGTARLIYQGESGALNESYSDIFGTIISNSTRPDIAKWDWLIGDGISSAAEAMRDMQDPTRFEQPKLMKNFVDLPLNQKNDFGGVHRNSGIHNYAAFHVMTANNGTEFIFKPHELAAMFYVALTQQLSRQSTFSDSRRGVVLATRSLFRKLPQRQIDIRVAAVEAGFKAAGID
jgi:Zn-dependent metalloprotease